MRYRSRYLITGLWLRAGAVVALAAAAAAVPAAASTVVK